MKFLNFMTFQSFYDLYEPYKNKKEKPLYFIIIRVSMYLARKYQWGKYARSTRLQGKGSALISQLY